MKLWAEPFHQWQFLYSRCNWYDFTVLRVGGEWDHMFGNVEATVVFMGLGIRIVLSYAETDEAKRIARQIAEIDAR